MVDLQLRYDIIVSVVDIKQHFSEKRWKNFKKPIDKELKIGYNKYINDLTHLLERIRSRTLNLWESSKW